MQHMLYFVGFLVATLFPLANGMTTEYAIVVDGGSTGSRG